MKKENKHDRINKSRLTCFGCLGTTIFMLWFLYYALSVFLTLYSAEFDFNDPEGLNNRAKHILGNLFRMQQNYIFSHHELANDLNKLKKIDEKKFAILKYYQISIETPNQNETYTYLLPDTREIKISWPHPLEFIKVTINKNAKAYVSLMTINKGELSTILCASTKAALDRPSPPLIKNDRLICAPGTVEIDNSYNLEAAANLYIRSRKN